MDLTKPLDKGRALNFAGKSHWITFKYEKLSMLCYHCGRIVHGRQGCPERQNRRLNFDAMEKQWGAWLCADEPRRQTQSKQGHTGDDHSSRDFLEKERSETSAKP
jgi:hypothetical protein